MKSLLFFVLLIVVNLSLQHAIEFMCERLNVTEVSGKILLLIEFAAMML